MNLGYTFIVTYSMYIPNRIYILCFNLKYWMYKLRNLPNDTQVIFLLPNDEDHSHSRLQANFTSFLTIAASVPSSLTLLLNTYHTKLQLIPFKVP